VGLLFAPSYGPKNQNHCSAIFTCVSLYYLFAKANIWARLRWRSLINAVALTTFGSAVYVIAEFVLANFAGVSLSGLIPYFSSQAFSAPDSGATFMGLWVRPRGFSAEAGHMATIFEVGLPLTALAFTGAKRVFRVILFVVSLAGFLVLVSAAAIVAIVVAALFVAFRRRTSARVRWALAALTLLAGVVALTNQDVQLYADSLVLDRTLGLVGLADQEDASAADRSERVRVAVGIAADFPLGFGWGTASHLGTQGSELMRGVPFGFVSLPAEFLVAGGWLSLLCLLAFFTIRILRIAAVGTLDAQMLLLGLCSLSIHYLTISNYWYPVLWASLGLPSVYRAHLAAEAQQQV